MNSKRLIEEWELTSYALGELEAADRERVETALSQDPALQIELDEIIAFTGVLKEDLRDVSAPELTAAQQESVVTKVTRSTGTNASTEKPEPWGELLARWLGLRRLVPAMAMVAIVGGISYQYLRTEQPRGDTSGGGIAIPSKEIPPKTEVPVPGDSTPEVLGLSDIVEEEAESTDRFTSKPAVKLPTGQMRANLDDISHAERKDLRKAVRSKGAGALSGVQISPQEHVAEGFVMEQESVSGRMLHAPASTSFRPTPPQFRESVRRTGSESYDGVSIQQFMRVDHDPLSTFSIDVDTASYANVRRFLQQGRFPPPAAVRIEEMINYFDYKYEAPSARSKHPFLVHTETASAPWNPQHRLVRIGIQGKRVDWSKRPASNLVFLLDVSGSMNNPDKLPLVKQSLQMLSESLTEKDRVAIVVYASASGLVLDSTPGNDRYAILSALDRLQAGGSTNGGQGIQLAYDVAKRNFITGGINRVIMATDGDFNVGIHDRGQLIQLIEAKAKSGIFLSVLGFGTGNLKDSQMEQIADKGNGNYAYIDGMLEARKVLVEEAGGTLMTIAKDVKIQVEFNPAMVASYRLIGYENRKLAHRDFNDDTKDAGEIGAGHNVTALYEIIPTGVESSQPGVDALKYQKNPPPVVMHDEQKQDLGNGELLTVKVRYKQPDGDRSTLLEQAIRDSGHRIGQASQDLKFAAGVSLFGMLLRNSPYVGQGSFGDVLALVASGTDDPYRREFIGLVQQAQRLRGE